MKRLVVIGGGFAGSHIAKKLEKSFDITLIDTKDYFEFTPSILRTIVEPKHVKKIQVLHSHYLHKTKIIRGRVKELHKDYVVVGNKKIMFDYCVVCSGSTYNSPFKEADLVVATRASNLRNCYKELCRSEKVLIIGGGIVGVELAAEISSSYPDKKITLVHAKDKMMERNHFSVSKYAHKILKKKGVKVLFNEKVVKGKKNIFFTDKGTKLKTDIAFLCTGIKANGQFIKNDFSNTLNKKGQLKVNKYLQIVGHNNIFAAGDITNVHEEKTAQNAKWEARTVIHNIKAMEEQRNMKEYGKRCTPLVISLGKWNGIYVGKYFRFYGLIPGVMKGIIEKINMLSY